MRFYTRLAMERARHQALKLEHAELREELVTAQWELNALGMANEYLTQEFTVLRAANKFLRNAYAEQHAEIQRLKAGR